jgi:hypothetical protein
MRIHQDRIANWELALGNHNCQIISTNFLNEFLKNMNPKHLDKKNDI